MPADGIDVRIPTTRGNRDHSASCWPATSVSTPGPMRAEGFKRIWEPDRSFCAWDGPEMVGTSVAFSLQLTVPGGTVAAGGTTMVSVAPTHRRRGILRQMMAAHLRDVADRGEPLSALWASESSIYGRFGYGLAAQGVDLRIPRQYTNLHRLAPSPAPIRLVDEQEARRHIPSIYERWPPWWPGLLCTVRGVVGGTLVQGPSRPKKRSDGPPVRPDHQQRRIRHLSPETQVRTGQLARAS